MQDITPAPLTPPGARTIVLDLIATRQHTTLSAADLVRAGAAFGIEPTGMRTAIARLKADGRIRLVSRGHYTAGDRTEPLQRRLRGWRSIVDRRRTWSGSWMLALISSIERADRTVLRRTIRALEIGGFREAEPGMWMRPDNLVGGVSSVRTEFAALGAAPSMLMANARDLDGDREARLPSLWRAAELASAHLDLAMRLDAHAGMIEREPVPAAAAATLILGRAAIRRIIRDPLLPDQLGGIDALETLIDSMNRYDVVGRRAWQAFWARPSP